MFARRRRFLPRPVQYLLALVIVAWVLRTVWFFRSALFSGDEGESDCGELGPCPKKSRSAKTAQSSKGLGGLDDDDDFDGPMREEDEVESDEDDDVFGSSDSTTADASSSSARRMVAGGAFYVQPDTKGFWNYAFRAEKTFQEVSSWSENYIRWFVGGACAVRSGSVDDRISLACEDYGLRLLYRNSAVRHAALAAKVVRLARGKNRRCLIPDDFILKPLTAFDRDIFSRIPETETVLVRDKEDSAAVKLVAALEAYAALEKTDRIVVERFVPNPMLVDGRKFSMRAWVIPLQLRPSLLGYFALGDAAMAKARLEEGPDEILANVATDRLICWDDLMKKGVLPPRSILLPHIKRVSLFILTALADHEVSFEDNLQDTSVVSEPFCIDFEVDEGFKVYVVNIAGGSDCEAPSTTKCKNAIDIRDVLEVTERYAVQKQDFKAEKRLGTLDLLVDEATFSSVADELCLTSPSPYEMHVRYHRHLKRKIESEILRQDGTPKTKYVSASFAPACSECGYEGNDAHASHCDVCGTRLDGASGDEPDDDEQEDEDDIAREAKDATYRNRLVKLFEAYDPPRLANVDVLLQRYRGEEDALIVRLTRQYEALSKRS